MLSLLDMEDLTDAIHTSKLGIATS